MILISENADQVQTQNSTICRMCNVTALYKCKHSWIAHELIKGTHNQSPASDVTYWGFFLQNMLSKFVQQSHCLENLGIRCRARNPD